MFFSFHTSAQSHIENPSSKNAQPEWKPSAEYWHDLIFIPELHCVTHFHYTFISLRTKNNTCVRVYQVRNRLNFTFFSFLDIE